MVRSSRYLLIYFSSFALVVLPSIMRLSMPDTCAVLVYVLTLNSYANIVLVFIYASTAAVLHGEPLILYDSLMLVLYLLISSLRHRLMTNNPTANLRRFVCTISCYNLAKYLINSVYYLHFFAIKAVLLEQLVVLILCGLIYTAKRNIYSSPITSLN